jgi:hypothetical protein
MFSFTLHTEDWNKFFMWVRMLGVFFKNDDFLLMILILLLLDAKLIVIGSFLNLLIVSDYFLFFYYKLRFSYDYWRITSINSCLYISIRRWGCKIYLVRISSTFDKLTKTSKLSTLSNLLTMKRFFILWKLIIVFSLHDKSFLTF